MTATTTMRTIVCPHCHGSGVLEREITDQQAGLLDRLSEAGSRRKAANRHTVPGRDALAAAYEDIRRLTPEAAGAGLSREQIAAAVGISRQQLAVILARKTVV